VKKLDPVGSLFERLPVGGRFSIFESSHRRFLDNSPVDLVKRFHAGSAFDAAS
jgi:hypothetical protein